jgi:hypothetical protein
VLLVGHRLLQVSIRGRSPKITLRGHADDRSDHATSGAFESRR